MRNVSGQINRGLGCAETVANGCMVLGVNLFCLLFIGLALYFFLPSLELARHGQAATGRVVGMAESSASATNGLTYAPIVEFEVDGRGYRFESNSASYPPQYSLGEQVPVLFNPNDPEHAEIDSLWNSHLLYAGLLAVSLMLWLLLNVVMFRRMRRGESL